MMETVTVSKTLYGKFLKWAGGITLKEFRQGVKELGLSIEEDNLLNWNIMLKGCKIATIDPINECTMQTSNLFYTLSFKYELFELLTNLAYTWKEDRQLYDFFEEWQYENK